MVIGTRFAKRFPGRAPRNSSPHPRAHRPLLSQRSARPLSLARPLGFIVLNHNLQDYDKNASFRSAAADVSVKFKYTFRF